MKNVPTTSRLEPEASMPEHKLPRVRLGSLEVARLIAGSNPVNGFSHASAERSRQMVEYFTVERVKWHLRDCEAHGIDALIARADSFTLRVLAEYWREGGRLRWIAQTTPEFRDPLRNIRQAEQAGASAVFVHGGEVDRLFGCGQPQEILRQVECIRSLGLPAGAAAHVPAHHRQMQRLGFPLDFHMVCLYNLTGYRGSRNQEPVEHFDHSDRAEALETLRALERPCIAYKILGAGRLTLEQALADVGPALRPTDALLIGMFPPDRSDIVGENVRAVAALTG
jgi:hypothetical protein